uniref:Uncharacterized protein n=1 Tax=Candidatus Kentrum sp. UNK TaxID=2126344 RepID=A0A451B4C2_9GAMM|nr:MAG: hypothetical protein BECKUNK1418G_GA0071005_116112 [Candidatus Kentron sp. UNK]VFK73087.1 MAG: hypothetical protein BECKUNK1418H_GA0071006_116112 [Candidatus Kentron sp. UNK]
MNRDMFDGHAYQITDIIIGNGKRKKPMIGYLARLRLRPMNHNPALVKDR